MTASVCLLCVILITATSFVKSSDDFNGEKPDYDEISKHKANYTCPDLGINEACLTIESNIEKKLVLYKQSVECDKCSLLHVMTFNKEANLSIAVDTSYATNIFLNTSDQNCSEIYHFGEHGIYTLTVSTTEANELECKIVISKEAENIYIPLFVALGVYVFLAASWITWKYISRLEIVRTWLLSDSYDVSDLSGSYTSNAAVQQNPPQKPRRLRSLDTVRGISIVVMIFVNYGGGSYEFFDHAPWNGLHVADLVFPWFIWIMGVSLALSSRSLLRKAISRRRIFLKIVKRSIILFSLGIMLNTFGCDKVDLNNIRIPGVLQRFGISYFAVATLHLFFAQPQDSHDDMSWAEIRDIVLYWIEWIIMLGVLLLYLLLTFLLPVPGCPDGYLGPGGNQDQGKYFNCTGGAAGYIDRIVLGNSHIYQHPTLKAVYNSALPYDPEGILGCLTSIFLVYLGLQAGKILLTYQSRKARIYRWLIWSVVMGSIAILLTKGTKNDGWIPINKNLWSPTFIFATGSMAFFLLTICYIVIDVKGWWSGAPFYYPGMNSILLYVGHSLTGNIFPWGWKMAPYHGRYLGMNLWGTSIWVIISIWLYYKKFFLAI